MNPTIRYLIPLVLLLFGTSLAMAGKLSIVVSIPPQKYFVEQIGGNEVEISVMVGPGQSPTTFTPTPRQMVALTRADLYYRIGVPFEEVWLPRILAANPGLPVLDAREGIELRAMEPAGVHHHDDDPAQHGMGRLDPHVWLSPVLVKQMALGIRDRLTQLDPERRALFHSNCRKFIARLEGLDAEIHRVLAGLERREFMVFHPSWGYFADRYRLRQIPIESEGKEPGARALIRLIDRAAERGMRVIFVQKQFGQDQARAIARAVSGHIVVIDPLAEAYPDNLRQVARAIAGDGQ